MIYRYDSESSYFKRQRSTKEFEIRLDEVRPIAINEIVHVHVNNSELFCWLSTLDLNVLKT